MIKNDYTVVEHLGTIGKTNRLTTEVNVVQNRSGMEMIDIAMYTIEGHELRAHVALYPDMVEKLRDLLNEINITLNS